MTFQRRRRGDRTQREAGPFGVTPPSYPRRHGERRDACEPSGPTSVSVNASCARGPDNPHVSPIGGGLGRLPTMPPIGFSCALKGSCCQQRGPAASTATTTDTTAPKTQTTSPTTPDFRRFSPRWSALWAPHHLKPRPHRHQTGGNGVIRTTTRRRHADRQPLMLQNPHRHRRGGHRGGTAGPGSRGTGEIGRPGCGPRCPWAAGPDNDPTRRSKLAARTAEAGGTNTTASQISHAIPPQHESTQAQKPQNINDQNPKPDMRSRELHAKLLVGSHSWASGRCAEPHISTLSSPAAHPAPPTPKNPRVHKQQPAPHSNT